MLKLIVVMCFQCVAIFSGSTCPAGMLNVQCV